MADKVVGYIGKQSATPPGGTEPPDKDMEARVAKLEGFVTDARDRLVHIETRLDHTATKADLHEAINSQTWKLVTFVCGFGTALTAAVYFMAKHAS